MVEIQCPHCEEDVELEDGEFGLFDCPYCDDEFEYAKSGLNVTLKVGLGLLFGSILVIILGIIFLNGAINGFNDTEIECEYENKNDMNTTWDDWDWTFIIPSDCSSEGNGGIGSFCCSIVFILIGIGIGISVVVSLLTGAVGGNKKVMIIQKGK